MELLLIVLLISECADFVPRHTDPYNRTLTFQTPLDVFMNFFMHAINTVIQDQIFSNVFFLCFSMHSLNMVIQDDDIFSNAFNINRLPPDFLLR